MCEYHLPCPMCGGPLGDTDEQTCTLTADLTSERCFLSYRCRSCEAVVNVEGRRPVPVKAG